MPPKAKPDTAGYIKLKKDLSAKTKRTKSAGKTRCQACLPLLFDGTYYYIHHTTASYS